MRLPIGTPGGDYNRVKCFVMLKDVEPDGGCLGLVPGSHQWKAGGPPQEFVGGNMGALPGHVRCAVPAGAMIMFDMRTWCDARYDMLQRSANACTSTSFATHATPSVLTAIVCALHA